MSKLIVYSRETFMGFFMPGEIGAIQAAAVQDPVVAGIWAQFVSKDRINASSAKLAQAMDVLVSKGLVPADRKAAVCR
jgi:hypothetical protein